ncbi:MAG: tellurite resistance TerB family protein [Pseudomonadota bacterium]
MTQVINHHSALIYAMVLMSASDGEMSDAEMQTIGEVVRKFPVFHDFDHARLAVVAEECGQIMSESEGLPTVLGLIAEALSPPLRETAYAAAVEVATADEILRQEELRILELMRDYFEIDRLRAGAIEHSARVRHRVV